MRSPVIAFSILAAVAVSPSMVSGAPSSPNLGNRLDSTVPHIARQLPGVLPPGIIPSAKTSSASGPAKSDRVLSPEQQHAALQSAGSTDMADVPNSYRKRAQDQYSAGGNAYTGASSDTSGGSVINQGSDTPDEDITNVENDGDQNAGTGGNGFTGEADGGNGDGFGPGGNAYTGATGASRGGYVVNEGGSIDNEAPSTGGGGGDDESGDAKGGDADDDDFTVNDRRAF